MKNKMFKRNIETYLETWKTKQNRKPLIIRGARQVGKSSTINKFGKENFSNIVTLNLETAKDANIFDEIKNANSIIETIKVVKNISITPGKTLLFIDEIQNSANAIQQLRFFYEEIPELHVIAAGSLLEVTMKKEGFSFPVGRVEYAYLHPATFDEFLEATGNSHALSFIQSFPFNNKTDIPKSIHKQLMAEYLKFILVGGMPEVVWQYAKTQSVDDLDSIYEALHTSFSEDVSKYTSVANSKYLQHIIEIMPKFSGSTIKYTELGGGVYKSREISLALDALEKAMIAHRIKPSNTTKLPITFNSKKAPKLISIDTGLTNYKQGMKKLLQTAQDLDDKDNTYDSTYKGRIAEQSVGRELLSLYNNKSTNIGYWYRNKSNSQAELDFIIQVDDQLIPIEVKSGKTGKLKSLFLFMEEAETVGFAIRVYSGQPRIDTLTTKNGKDFKLLSIPFYLINQLNRLVTLKNKITNE